MKQKFYVWFVFDYEQHPKSNASSKNSITGACIFIPYDQPRTEAAGRQPNNIVLHLGNHNYQHYYQYSPNADKRACVCSLCLNLIRDQFSERTPSE